jgi:transcriptional regulator with XRE-family HTH domain
MKKRPDEEVPGQGGFPRIGELFYRVRVLRGREWTLRRFAAELGVDHVMLSYVEKGQRLPGDALVRRLADVAGLDPRDCLATLHRERLVRGIARELRRVLLEPADGESGDGEDEIPVALSPVLSRVLAELPDSGEAVDARRFRKSIRDSLRSELGKATPADQARVGELLRAKGLVAERGGSVRKTARHVHAVEPEERFDLAVSFADVFAKSMLDELLRERDDNYFQSHFLTIERERLPELVRALDRAIAEVVERFASTEPAAGGEFFQVLVAGTTRK